MAGKPVGTIFVELDLDSSRYTKGQQQLLRDATKSSDILEKNFQNLGIKSAAHFDLLRSKAKLSFEAIANNSKATANDIIRAEEAKNAKLRELNEKQFGTQTSAIDSLKKHWLAATAAIYAAVQLVDKAIESAKTGALLEKQAAAFDNLTKSAGTSAASMLSNLKQASGGMIAEADLMAAAGKSLLMNIPAEKISALMNIAAATSRATGQTITEAFNDITLGVARQSRMILDNLGIIVNVDNANADYARTLGKTADALNDAEKRQAFMNAVLKSGDDMIRRLGSPQGSLDGVAKATAGWTDAMAALSKNIAEKSNPLFEAVAGVLKRINLELKAGSDAAKEYGSSVESVDERIAELNRKYGDMESRKSWGYNEAQDVEYRKLVARRKALSMEGTTDFGRGNVQGRFGSLAPEYYGGRRVSENEIAYDIEARWKSHLEMIKEQDDAAKKAADELSKESHGATSYGAWEDDYAKLEALRLQLIKTRQAASEFNMELYKKAAAGDTKRLEKEIPFLQKEGLDEQINEVVKSTEDGFNQMAELSQRTAERMQDNFSDIFFDMWQGKLKTAQDYFQAFTDTLGRIWSNMAGQMATEGIFGSKSVGGKTGGGGLVGLIAELFNSSPEQLGSAKGNVFGPRGLVPFRSGGIVDRPTVFPFARGTGLMGEAGPEAVVPLKRLPSGNLGVEASGGGSPKVELHVHNYEGVPVQQREQAMPDGSLRIDVMVGNIIKGQINNGAFDKDMANTYGLQRRGGRV